MDCHQIVKSNIAYRLQFGLVINGSGFVVRTTGERRVVSYQLEYLAFPTPTLNNAYVIIPRKPDFTEPAFKLDKDDRFYKIIVSDHVLFELYPETETIITFVVIRRSVGTLSVVNILKTFQKGICVSRSIQNKNGITAKNIDKEIVKIQKNFTQGVQAQTNYKTHWDALDLSKIDDKKEQLQRIKKWGKLKIC